MVGACSTNGEDEECVQYFKRKSEGKKSLDGLGIDGRIIFK
jgi:hypothetical protein